jgi:hypothetical protein
LPLRKHEPRRNKRKWQTILKFEYVCTSRA